MAQWPIKKQVTINGIDVSVTAEKVAREDNLAVVSVTAEANGVSHTEHWTLPRENPSYSKEQAQADFTAHIQKVAVQAASKKNSADVLESLV
jgi:hypothetical protein